MSSAATKKAIANEVAAPLPDGRAALAASITTRQKADAAVTRQEEAIERAQAMLDAADAELERARSKVADADEADTKRAATSIHNEVGVPSPWSGAQARGTVAAGEEKCTQLRLALDRLRADLVGLEDDASEAANDVAVAVKALVLPVAEAIYKQLLDHKRRVAVLGRILSELVADDERVAPRFHDSLRSMKAAGRRQAVMRELQQNTRHLLLVGADDAAYAAAALATWRAALAALTADAAAPLPPTP